MKCPACSQPLLSNVDQCPYCGTALDDPTPTRLFSSSEDVPTSPLPAPHSTSNASPISSSGRFVVGAVLAQRYRLLGLLGKGGMGEVYKAEDLKLNQIVALKFLPDALALDGAMLARFHNEVRIARQVSHPNVCRVYDIGEVGGLHFLSMEFIDGEDLASLLRRIGRLPDDKGIEIARQMCAGLAAAHDNGVLHRDLKPANVMIDGRGRARLTDFGLAVIAEELRGQDTASGTPAYMAPEQITGREVTTRSDIYSLGLVMYEMFTGKPVFSAPNVRDLIALHEKSTPTNPGSFVKDFDPLLERVILRCLEKDPAARPATALQVSAALPGGDPLAAALAAGETPSPEMVAAAGDKTTMKPLHVALCVVAIFLSLLLAAYFSSVSFLHERTYFENSAEVLARKGREIATQLGYPNRPADIAYAYQTSGYYSRVMFDERAFDGWKRLVSGKPYPMLFWYRESPRPLIGLEGASPNNEFTPAKTITNMVSLRMDMYGDLIYFESLPPQLDDEAVGTMKSPAPYVTATPDWNVLFQLAKLDITKFTPATPNWTPHAIVDTRVAWEGVHPNDPSIALRIEAASYRGKFVYFDVVGPWRKPWRSDVYEASSGEKLASSIQYALIMICSIATTFLVRRSFRRGLGDRRGAMRIFFVVFFACFVAEFAPRAHFLSEDEVSIFTYALRWSLFQAMLAWSGYLALEPFVRKIWPKVLITWNRVLTGNYRDGLVGRDLLLGVGGGVIAALIFRATEFWIFQQYGFVTSSGLRAFLGFRTVLGLTAASINDAGINIVYTVMLVFLIRLVVKNNWLTAIIFLLITDVGTALTSIYPVTSLTSNVLADTVVLLLLFRYGLLAAATALLMVKFLNNIPLTVHTSLWFSWMSFYVTGIVGVIAVFAARLALAGQRFLPQSLDD